MTRAFVAAAIVAFAIDAHAPVPSRTLRLQLENGRLQGLVEFHLPAQGARVYSAAPDLAIAVTPRALAGLKLEIDGAPVQPKVVSASATRAPDGAIDAKLLLDVGPALGAGKSGVGGARKSGAAGARKSGAGKSLRISVEAEPPLPIALIAQSGIRLHLDSGPGAPMPGGLALRPRPGVPCVISIVQR